MHSSLQNNFETQPSGPRVQVKVEPQQMFNSDSITNRSDFETNSLFHSFDIFSGIPQPSVINPSLFANKTLQEIDLYLKSQIEASLQKSPYESVSPNGRALPMDTLSQLTVNQGVEETFDVIAPQQSEPQR